MGGGGPGEEGPGRYLKTHRAVGRDPGEREGGARAEMLGPPVQDHLGAGPCVSASWFKTKRIKPVPLFQAQITYS